MRGLTNDTEEVFRYVTKAAAGAEDTSSYFLTGFLCRPDCFAAEILKRLNYCPTVTRRKRVFLPPEKVLNFAERVAAMTGYPTIDTQHVLLALAGCKNSEAADCLRQSNIDSDVLSRIVEGMSYHEIGKTETETFRFDPKSALGLEERLERRVIGQGEAVKAVAARLKRAAAGLQNPNRPIAAFLFTGSTGVGKTELAKAIAEEVYGADSLIKFDMSEYSDRASVTGLIGAPPAYVGYEEGGRLTERIKAKPNAVVLFDEIEKAHREVLNLLLQVLDEGTLTDMRGVKVNFTKSVVILTANALSCDIIKKKKAIGFDTTLTPSDEREMLKQAFPPEVLARLQVVRFADLSRDDYKKILKLELAKLNARLKCKKIRVTLSEEAEEEFSRDTGFGVRGIRTRVEETLEAKLSDGILTGEIADRSEIEVRYCGGEIFLNIKTTEDAKV